MIAACVVILTLLIVCMCLMAVTGRLQVRRVVREPQTEAARIVRAALDAAETEANAMAVGPRRDGP